MHADLLDGLVQRQMVLRPRAIALRDGFQEVTYARLGERAARIADVLRQHGVGVEDVVGLHLQRGRWLIEAMLGTLQAGAAYLPLDLTLPDARLAYMLAAAAARLVLVAGGVGPSVPGAAVLDLEALDLDTRDAGQPPVPRRHPDQLAYVLYTSGSTGRPKPVAITHRALVNHARAVIDRYRLRAGERVLQFAAPGFDVLAEEVFPTLAAGGTIVSLPRVTPSPAELEAFIAAESIAVANVPTPYWNGWARSLDDEPRPLPGSLRLLVVGSDAAYRQTLVSWRKHTAVPVINAYGLTEAAITVTTRSFAGADPPDLEMLPVGHAIPGAEVRVLGPDMRPVAPGQPGELFVGGLALARGYHRQPGLTAERFLPDPEGRQPGARLHRTGDRARIGADGGIELLGRLDDQVKVLGQRIEPAEIAAVLRRHPAIADAFVAARASSPDAERSLVAYVVPRPETPLPDAAALRCYLASELTAVMIPTSWVVMDALPLAPNGKIERRALPAPGTALSDVPRRPLATATEELVARHWRETLRLERVGIDDSFFDLGGHSMLLAQVRRRLVQELGREIPSTALFEHPTIRSLARYLDGGAQASWADGRAGELRRGRGRLERLRALRNGGGGEP